MEKIYDLLEDYISCESCENRKKLKEYIKNNKLTEKEYRTIILTILNIKNLFDYIPCYNYRIVMENIENEEFLDNEDNYMF